ncbi:MULTISPECIES: stage V sporulation protein B [Bacillus]|uniref:stage V sporulation protein B n=1 Tax=Bacillus TaxID=1386 RepID=UPI0002F99C14|nr:MULTISPECIES: stage V sporulation protein B [Bacillus]
MSKFFQGTLILLTAGLITRVLGFINRIVVARVIGGEGVGLYMMALPSLFLVITITQLGLPVAIAKFVAEANAVRDEKRIKKILVVSLSVTLGLSVIFTPALMLLAPWLSQNLFTDDRIYWPLLTITPIIPIVAVSAVIRGYFQGKQNMKPSAYSQILEQIIRIALIAFMTKAFLPYGIEYAAAAAMFSSVIGELASLTYLLTLFKLKKHFRFRKNFFLQVSNGKETLKQLLSIALPSTGSRLISNISWFFEPIVVAQSLAIAGVSTALATSQYGELMGYAWPLLMLPSFITMALSTSLVPAISEAQAVGNIKLVSHRLHQALRITFFTGCLAIVILFVFADPIMNLMYGKTNAAIFITYLAPICIFAYYQMPLQSVLQALNLARAAMMNSLIGAIVKLALIFILSSQPQLGIMGTAMGFAASIVLVTFLHFATVAKRIPIFLEFRSYILTIIITVISGWTGHMFYKYIEVTSSLYIAIAITVLIFMTLSLMLKVITLKEIRSFLPFKR